jgi:hypothetical protein
VEPAVVSVFIKSDRLRKRVPRVGEMVRLDGRHGLYVVMRVDRHHKVADLIHKGALREFEENVPFSAIQLVGKDLSQAIQQFLNSTAPDAEGETKIPAS